MSLKHHIISEIRRATYPVQSGQIYLRTSPELLADKIVGVLQANGVNFKPPPDVARVQPTDPVKGKLPRG
jgi:hypothetical protein